MRRNLFFKLEEHALLERQGVQLQTILRVRKGRCHQNYVRAVPCRQVQGTDGIVCVHAVRGGKELGGVGRDVVQHLLRMRGGEGRTGSRGERLCRVRPWIHSGVVTAILLIKTVHFNDFTGAVVSGRLLVAGGLDAENHH